MAIWRKNLGSLMTILFALTLAFALILPSSAAAERRSSPVQSRLYRSAQHKISKADLEQIEIAVIEYLAFRIQLVETASDYDRVFLSELPARDRADLKPLLPSIIPKVHTERNVLIVGEGKEALRFRWKEFPGSVLFVNGVEWALNPHKPLKPQTDLLIRKLKASSNASALHLLLLPETSAAGVGASALIRLKSPVTAVVTGIGVFAATLGPFFHPLMCKLFVSAAGVENMKWGCGNWIAEQDRIQKLLEAKAPPVNSLEKSRENVDKNGTEYKTGAGAQCPSRVDKSKNVYIANLQEVKVFDKTEVGPKFSVRLDYLPEGKPKEGFTAPAGTDMSNPTTAMDKAENIFKFDNGLLKTIEYPNPNFTPETTDPGIARFLKIDLTEDGKLEPDQITRRDKIKEMVKQINDFVAACLKFEQMRELKNAQVEGKSPGPIGAPVGAQPTQAMPSGDAPTGATK